MKHCPFCLSDMTGIHTLDTAVPGRESLIGKQLFIFECQSYEAAYDPEETFQSMNCKIRERRLESAVAAAESLSLQGKLDMNDVEAMAEFLMKELNRDIEN